MKRLIFAVLFIAMTSCAASKKFKWTMINVPEEGGISFVQITRDGSDVSSPAFNLSGWYTGRMLDVSPDGEKIIYIDYKNKTRNVYVKSTGLAGAAVQRTFRAGVNSACFSPDGEEIVFCESRDGKDLINITSAEGGNLLHQIAEGTNPSYSSDGSTIFFSRYDEGSWYRNKKTLNATNNSVWSYNRNNGLLTNYSTGNNPQPLKDQKSFICERTNEKGYGEIWLVDCEGGSESMILSMPGKNFTTPSVSPDGNWIVLVANSSSNAKNVSGGNKKEKVFSFVDTKQNTDIYVVRTNGSQLTQLTYHKGNDCSPTWSPDGKYIYFLSQRGSKQGNYNVWRMNFSL
ncbi:MAG: PD40 domain-containing protein [Rikenellaceae bacterium]|nr:PD40 domain-containing protein [Rikenellaceae bacterium]